MRLWSCWQNCNLAVANGHVSHQVGRLPKWLLAVTKPANTGESQTSTAVLLKMRTKKKPFHPGKTLPHLALCSLGGSREVQCKGQGPLPWLFCPGCHFKEVVHLFLICNPLATPTHPLSRVLGLRRCNRNEGVLHGNKIQPKQTCSALELMRIKMATNKNPPLLHAWRRGWKSPVIVLAL